MSVQTSQPNDTNSLKNSLTAQGRLTIVGCGLHPGHMTMETESHIKNADIVLVVAPNPLSIQHIRQLNPNVENLGLLYEGDVNRLQTYHLMADRMVELASHGQNVCAIYYGHPGIFVLSTHMAREQLEEADIPVTMLPGISADACLFADLNLDPATTGCQSYEATQFLLSKRSIDTGASLILWQVGLVGEHTL
ncbi:MAG: SAM-dependent methyltransferase, partial [Kangiellaceae bacterium]|nr:SAM-dependent methyltransferase [Kangiellaceae bacterium]